MAPSSGLVPKRFNHFWLMSWLLHIKHTLTWLKCFRVTICITMIIISWVFDMCISCLILLMNPTPSCNGASCCFLLFGGKHSPYLSFQGQDWVLEFSEGYTWITSNAFHWEQVHLNIPTTHHFYPSLPGLLLLHSDVEFATHQACDVDNIHLVGPGNLIPRGGNSNWVVGSQTMGPKKTLKNFERILHSCCLEGCAFSLKLDFLC